MTPSVETTGSAGTTKPRGTSGLRRRMIQTPMQTRMNANSVPMLVISPTTSSGMNAANKDVNTKNSQLDLCGVLNVGCACENTGGTRPSRLIEKNTRDCPSSITRMTDEKAARIATVTKFD